MSLDKTTKHNYRLPTDLEKYAVYDALPLYFESEYPKLISFMEKYYEFADTQGFGEKLNDLEVKRDLVEASDQLLQFFSKELLLGRDYFDRFIDKKTAIAVSNLLYRSKGTKYSIQQFFRVFFGFDVDVRYGRDEVFLVGDPYEEVLVYEGQYKGNYLYPGDRLRFTFDDGTIQVFAVRKLPKEILKEGDYVETNPDYLAGYSQEYGPSGQTLFHWPENGYNEERLVDGRYAYAVDDYVEPFTRELVYNVYEQLREDVDYIIDYADKSVILQPVPDGYDPVASDPWIEDLATYGKITEEGQKVKVEIKRWFSSGSPVGADVSEKRITNNGFWQMFSILIRAPISVSKWKEAYKDFVHPAGMYLEGQVLIESQKKVGIAKQDNATTEQYRKLVTDTAELKEFVYTMLTELNIRPGSARISAMGLPNNPWLDSDGTIAYPDEIYRSRVNDIKRLPFTLAELDQQYDSLQGMARIDDIAPRRLDEVSADMSNTINTLDENLWHKERIGNFCPEQHVLGAELDYPPEHPGCPNFVFAVGRQMLQGQYREPKLMNQYYIGDDAHPKWSDPNHSGYIDLSQFTRETPGPVTGLAEWKLTAYRDNRVWDDYVAHDYTIETPSDTPSSVWIGNTDYANRFQRAQITASVTLYHNYFRSGFIERYYMREIADSDGFHWV